MEKLIYMLDRGAFAPAQLTSKIIKEVVPAMQKLGARQITVNITDLDEPVKAASPNRIAGAWDQFGVALHFWLDSIDQRAGIEALFNPLGLHFDGYLVTESVPQRFERTWPDGERRPGVTQFCANAKPENISEEDFYYNWQVTHSKISFDLHPHRWSYVRNAVARPLTPKAPPFRAIVLEHFRELRDFTDESRYFGDPQVVQDMYAELPGFCEVTTMITGPMSEYYFE